MKSLMQPLMISTPIIQAPMAGAATAELVAAVSNAGGLGSLGGGYLSPEQLRKTIHKIREATKNPFAVNLFIPGNSKATPAQITKAKKAILGSCQELALNPDTIQLSPAPNFEKQLRVVLEERVPIFSFTFGLPEKSWIERFKKEGVVLIGTATNLEEGLLLEAAGIDMIAAQSSEAGGHRGTFAGSLEESLIKLSTLIPLLVNKVNRPIIASGGIMDAPGIASALQLGAAAVQMGTAFLSCKESGAHPLYKEALLTTTQDNTTLTRAFSGKWARGIKNTFINRMEAKEKDILDYPLQNALTTPMREEAKKQNSVEFMSLFAGQAAQLCRSLAAADLVQELNHNLQGIYP